MRVLIGPDKFRGTATAWEICAAVADTLEASGHQVITQPLADGGEGTLDAFGGPNRTTTVTGPLGELVHAPWRLDRDTDDGHTAVIETATASGMALVGGAEGNDVLAASTFGTGELIVEAVDRGADRIVLGLGGSATTDGGLGALRAMEPLARFRGLELVVATDVLTLFTDAAAVFGPQKGATPAQVRLLTGRLERLAQVYEETHGRDVRELPGSGAAGGLAGGLAAIGAQIAPGFDFVADAVGLHDAMTHADLVVTGEGKLDDQSFNGKVIGGVADMAAELGRPVLAVAGVVDLTVEAPAHVTIVSLTEQFGSDAAMTQTAQLVAKVVADHLSSR